MHHEPPKSWLLSLPFLPTDPAYIHVNGAIVVTLFILVFSLLVHLKIRGRTENYLVPEPKASLFNIVDMLVEGLHGMVRGVLGHHGDPYFPMIASLFVFVLLCNFLGLLPHGAAPTASVNTTLALGVFVFIYYNLMGIRAHGFVGYLKHFLMGLGVAGIPIAILELVSHVIRPASLGIRLYVNMFVDHAVVGAFSSIVAWLLPVPLLLFGIVVSTIQAFVFSILTAVYVQMATEHEEEH